MRVAVVTDSTAYLPRELALDHGIQVVPVHVVIAGTSYDEGLDVSAGEVADALRQFRPVSTARPSPDAFARVYGRLADTGATQIVSIHLSGKMSATVDSARLAAQQAPVQVRVIDSEAIGMTMGYAVLHAAELADRGASVDRIERAVRAQVDRSSTVFYVDTLEHLRRGGRIGKASAILGSALSIKPLLTLRGGQIEVLEKVRTTSKALGRLEAVSVQAAGQLDEADGVDLAVHHLDSRERAEQLSERLAQAIPYVRRLLLVELGAVVGAHVGPGTVAVSVCPGRSDAPESPADAG